MPFRALRNFDAAKLEIEEAIRNKPDYQIAYYDLGILLHDLHDYDGAIAQYKRALSLKPDDVQSRYNLGLAYQEKR